MNKNNSYGCSSCSLEEYEELRNIKYFLILSERTTGISRKKIKVISFEIDEKGLFSGLIEVDGNREFIHEYI